MELLLERRYKKETYTIGQLYVDGVPFCQTVEDKDRGLSQDMNLRDIERKKVYGKTAIPAGRYKVILSYSNKFGKILPEILNVKGFAGIRIHSGNTAEDSLGCVIVGENKIKGGVINSRATMEKLMNISKNQNEIFLTIK